jgi:hypothetical protein
MATLQNSNTPSAPLSDDIWTEIGDQQVRRSNTFTPTEDYSLEYIVALVEDNIEGSCVNIVAEIFLAANNVPTGLALASVAVLEDQIPDPSSGEENVTFTFSSPLAVTNGTEYCLVLRSDAPVAERAAKWYYGFTNTGLAATSSDDGDTWGNPSTIPGRYFEVWGTAGAVFSPPATNLTTLKRLVAVADNKVYYET